MGRAIVVAAALPLVLVAAASARTTAADGLIVFPATPEGTLTNQLFSVQASGDGLRQITKGAYPAIAPAFSPTGKRIAFVRAGIGIFTMNPDGSGLRRLTTSARDAYPAWSPDGRQIAFVRPIGQAWKVFVVSTASGKHKPRQLVKSPPAGRPSWTKAGLLIPSGGDILRIDTTTGRVLKYYSANVDAIWGLNSVAIAPSIKLLTFVGSRDPEPGDKECGEGPCQRFGLYLENLTLKKKVPKLIVKDTGPAAFSPDGKNLAYVLGGSLVVRPVGSSQSTSISTPGATPVIASPPAWH